MAEQVLRAELKLTGNKAAFTSWQNETSRKIVLILPVASVGNSFEKLSSFRF
jgi:hypothetical protein